MRRIFLARAACCAIAALGVTFSNADAPAGTFGFVAAIDADGIFDPVLKTVTIQKVEPGLPAASAGIAVGDTIIEVEGKQVAGAKAKELEPLMRKQVGEVLRLKLRRASGESYTVSMVAAARR
jgi:C-terminal processing protease CtpA/Prc